jgi:hypothetical protein
MAQETYTFRITERELRNPIVRKHLLALVEIKLKLQRHKPFLTISKVELTFIRHHFSWRNVQDYLPNKKDRIKGEQGKYNGKRVVVRGMK